MTGGPARGRLWLNSVLDWERLGYTSLLVTDHVDASAGLVASLAAAVSHTSRMIVGSLTAAIDFRHPVLLCKEMATLNRLWPGRIELGLGAGWSQRDYSQLGMKMDPFRCRLDRLREGVAIVRQLLGGAPLTFPGEHFDLQDASLGTSGAGAIPLILGGGGRQMLALAAAQADIVALNPQMLSTGPVWNSATLDSTRAKTRYVMTTAGERAAELELAIVIYHLFSQPTDEDVAFASRSLGIDTAAVADSPHCLFGDASAMATTLLARREDLNVSYVIVTDTSAEQLAPVISLLREQDSGMQWRPGKVGP